MAGERALVERVEKTVFAPAHLGPADLGSVVAEYGRSGAVEVVSMLGAFHFINRIADLVGIQSDLPAVQPRWAGLRRAGVRLQGWVIGKMLDNVAIVRLLFDRSLDQAFSKISYLP